MDRVKLITGSVLEYAITCDPGLYLVDKSATDTPISRIWYYARIYDVAAGHRIVELFAGANKDYQEVYYNTYNVDGKAWHRWALISTATIPQVYDLPLADGYETYASSSGYENVYYKDQEGIVSVEISIRKIDGFKTGSYSAIAQLPEGFRPAFMKHNMACSYGPYGWSAIFVRPSGTIDVYISNDCTSVFGELHFIAKDQA